MLQFGSREAFGNPEEGESPLESATKQRLVETLTAYTASKKVIMFNLPSIPKVKYYPVLQ